MKTTLINGSLWVLENLIAFLNVTLNGFSDMVNLGLEDFNPVMYNLLEVISKRAIIPLSSFIMFLLAIVSLYGKMLFSPKNENRLLTLSKWVVQLFIIILLLMYSLEIVTNILNLPLSSFNKIAGIIGESDAGAFMLDTDALKKTLKSLSTGANLGVFLIFVISLLFVLGTYLGVYYVIYYRYYEIALYATHSSLSIAMFAESHFEHAGWNFLKNIFSLALQPITMIIIIAVYKSSLSLASLVIDTDGTFPIIMSILGIIISQGILVKLLWHSRAFTKNLIGCH